MEFYQKGWVLCPIFQSMETPSRESPKRKKTLNQCQLYSEKNIKLSIIPPPPPIKANLEQNL